jgi:hypothetical protein
MPLGAGRGDIGGTRSTACPAPKRKNTWVTVTVSTNWTKNVLWCKEVRNNTRKYCQMSKQNRPLFLSEELGERLTFWREGNEKHGGERGCTFRAE